MSPQSIKLQREKEGEFWVIGVCAADYCRGVKGNQKLQTLWVDFWFHSFFFFFSILCIEIAKIYSLCVPWTAPPLPALCFRLSCLDRLLSGGELSYPRGAETACLVTHHSDLNALKRERETHFHVRCYSFKSKNISKFVFYQLYILFIFFHLSSLVLINMLLHLLISGFYSACSWTMSQ